MIKSIESKIVRRNIIEKNQRIDGRDKETIRPIQSEITPLPAVHGSSVFTRGETQAVVAVTLGGKDDELMVDTLSGKTFQPFMLHYNFPAFSVGETRRQLGPGRREIGHGKLAWRAINPVLPKENFPYTVRIVSEITESNGSSSMATVCGSSLSLMDAGVKITSPVAGIAMGLIKDDDNFAVISDILGDEDHLGDMDFKVAGTQKGITALQMDIKINGITSEIMEIALTQAKQGRLHILSEMAKTIEQPREDYPEHAPQITQINIDVSKIKDVIGSGGKVIKDICEKSGAKVSVSDDGKISILSNSSESMEIATNMITEITIDAIPGKIYQGKVTKTTDFGAFVKFWGPKEGLVHISQISNTRVEKTEDLVKESQIIYVKFIGFEERGKLVLSMKLVDQNSGEDLDPNNESVKALKQKTSTQKDKHRRSRH